MKYNDWNMFGAYALISTGVIVVGDEITFDYSQSENVIASPFICACCNKLIEGKLSNQI